VPHMPAAEPPGIRDQAASAQERPAQPSRMIPERDERPIVTSLSKAVAASSASAAQRYSAAVTRSSPWLAAHGPHPPAPTVNVRPARPGLPLETEHQQTRSLVSYYSRCTVRSLKIFLADVTAAAVFWIRRLMTLFSGVIPEGKKPLL
jgi:hypothetical protein